MLTTIEEPTEGIFHVERNTKAFFSSRCIGKGVLFVTEDKLSWRDDSTGQGFNLAYPDISLHAVSKDTTHFPHECLFCMVDVAFQDETQNDNECEEDDPASTELRFVPDDKSTINDIYTAICDCQVLHPDEQEQLEDEMAGYPPEDEEEYFCGEDDGNLTEEGQENLVKSDVPLQAVLERLENTFQIQSQEDFVKMTNGNTKTENGQFDDMDD